MKSLLSLFFCVGIAAGLSGQSISLPPGANNQYGAIIQGIGLAEVRIDYHSPDVDGREGKIWGQLVPYNEGKPFPWRGGANENTTFTFSHDASVLGQPIEAGSYGFHIIPAEDEWTIIFNKVSTSWGSFTYNQADDMLRVKVKLMENEFTEFLNYNFIVKKPDYAVVELAWEKLKIEIRIDIDNKEVILASLRQELKGAAGAGPNTWKNWADAAAYCLQNDFGNNDEILGWSNRSIALNPSFIGYITKYKFHAKLNQNSNAETAWSMALTLGSSEDLYRLGRSLVAEDKADKALLAFKKNKEKFENVWPVNLGLGRGYQAVGDNKNAKKYFEKALAQAGSDRQKMILNDLIAKVK